MNKIAYDRLEYDKIKERLKDFAISELGIQSIERLTPSDDINRIRNDLNETSEARAIIDKSSNIPIQNLVGIQKVMDKLGKGIALQPDELSMVSGMLKSTKKIKTFMLERNYEAPTISQYAFSMYELADVIEEIERCIVLGRVDDKASPQLEKVRKRIIVAENRIKLKLESIIQSPNYKKILQDTIISIKHNRYVVAVKSQYKRNIEGHVIEASATGSTLFIEPTSVRKLQSDLDLLKAEEEKEIYQIVMYLTALIESYEKEIHINVETMTYYDFIFAKGKYSASMDGLSAEVNYDGYTKIINGKHPLLHGEVVPLNYEIGKSYKSLVITGPNTGGKTVALKTVGLLTLMIQSGLHVSVDSGSHFAIYSDILVDIGDGQSIEHSLSTFSAHVKNIIDILKTANKYTLVILDELGAGTDPAEGEGLAVAVLEELYEKEATTLATSHYSEVKAFAKRHGGYENGRMTFDITTLKPLYQLIIGEAGESNAFIIALRLGMNQSVIERAHEITYKESKDYTTYLESINKKLERVQYKKVKKPKAMKQEQLKQKEKDKPKPSVTFAIGDVVFVHTLKKRGTVYEMENKKGEIGVMVQNKKMLIQKKRISPFLDAKDLYPDYYNFDIVFETKEYRKKNNKMSRKYDKDLVIQIKGEDNISI